MSEPQCPRQHFLLASTPEDRNPLVNFGPEGDCSPKNVGVVRQLHRSLSENASVPGVPFSCGFKSDTLEAEEDQCSPPFGCRSSVIESNTGLCRCRHRKPRPSVGGGRLGRTGRLAEVPMGEHP